MSSVLPASAAPGFAPHEVRRGPLAGFSRRHWLLIACFAFITPLAFAVFTLAFGERIDPLGVAGEMGKYLVIGCMTVCFALATDNLLRHRVGSVWSLAIALLAASVLSTAFIQLVTQGVIVPLGWDGAHKPLGKPILSSTQQVLLEFIGAVRWSLVLIALYELLESNRRAGEELHAARMTALAAQQHLVEGELRAMQARVDPALLFNSLLAIDEGYAQGLDRGQDRLDRLIRFLRAALPSDSAGTSSVAREQELVEAYVALSSQAPDGPQLDLRVDPDARAEQMPSMLLLPLVRWALAGQSVRNLQVRIQRQAESLAINVESDASKDSAAPLDEIASVRERLTQLYPQGAHLSVASGVGPWRALLEIPRQQLAPATASSR